MKDIVAEAIEHIITHEKEECYKAGTYNTGFKRFKIILDKLTRMGHICEIQPSLIKRKPLKRIYYVCADFDVLSTYRTRISAKRRIARHYFKLIEDESDINIYD